MALKRSTRWNEFLMDADGEFSFKRLFTGTFGLMFIALFWINLFTGRMVDRAILDVIETVIIVSIGTIGIEAFTKVRRTSVVSKDAIVTQESNALSGESAVSKAVDKIVGQQTPPPDTIVEPVPKVEEPDKPELLE